MISRIEAYRYRCFSTVAVDLGEYHVLAGPNGSGKTTLLDIPALLSDLLSYRVCSAAFLEKLPSRRAPRAHTLTELVFQGRGEEFWIALEARLPDEIAKAVAEASSNSVLADPSRWPTHLRYELRFRVFNQTQLHVPNEYLFLFPADRKPPERGGGLQGQPNSYSKKGRPSLRQKSWRSVIHREGGEPTQFHAEGSGLVSMLPLQVPPEHLALATAPADRTAYPVLNWFREFLQQGSVFFDPVWEELPEASPPGQPARVTPDGLSLPWLALRLQSSDPKRFQSWVEHVQTALPNIEAIEIREREEDHHAYYKITYRGGYTVTSSGLSDGTLRILSLTLMPYVRPRPALLLVGEPENGLHPQAIETVLQSLTSLYESQVWISTHSPIVLAHTDLARVLCMRLAHDGSAEALPGNRHPRLEKWRGEIDLGSLFAAGVLD